MTCKHGKLRNPALTEKRKTFGKPRTNSVLSISNVRVRTKVFAPESGRPVRIWSCACRVTINIAMSSNESNTNTRPTNISSNKGRELTRDRHQNGYRASAQAPVVKDEPEVLTVSN